MRLDVVRVAMRGVELAADPAHGAGEPWQVSKVYWNAMPESVMRDGIRRLKEAGDTSFDDWDVDGEMPSFVVPDDVITAVVEGMEHVEAKLAAMRAHATQIPDTSWLYSIAGNFGSEFMGVEYYTLALGERGPGSGPYGWEGDLFAGLDVADGPDRSPVGAAGLR